MDPREQDDRRDPLLRHQYADFAKDLLPYVRQRWSIDNSWHWVRDVTLKEDAHHYREGSGVQILATLRSLAINALRLVGIWSITEGIAALAHEIKGLLRVLGVAGSRGGTALRMTSHRPCTLPVAWRPLLCPSCTI